MSRQTLRGSAADTSESAYSAPALEKGLDILELLAAEDGGLSQTAIAQRLDRSAPEIFRMLSVLERRDYLNRQPDGAYKLSMRLFELGNQHPPLKRLISVALPAMQRMAESTRQSAHLVMQFARRILVVTQVDSPEPMGFSVRLGANFPFRPDRVSSCVLSAFQPEAVQEALITDLLDQGDPRADAQEVRERLRQIAHDGFYTARSDTVPGVTDLCGPVFDHSGRAIAALTVPYLPQRDIPVTPEAVQITLLETTRRISAALGAPEHRR
jgi:DNA-binding IclR family transcriptional regulator